MKKVMQIVLVMMVLVCIYRYTKSEATISLAQEPEKEDYAIETDREIENETENEPLEQIRSTVIGEVEILEKSIQANIEVEGWSRVRTWDLKYPYFSGEEAALLKGINNQIYEWVRERNMDDSDELYYIELTYEITYMDERIVSILFEGDGGGSSYYGNSHGMSFDLRTGELLSLTDFYEWSEWKNLMENAMEQDQLRTQILRGYTELEEEENREYLEEYFIPLFQEDSDLEQTNLDFFIKDGYLYFITHAYPSCREDSYVKWEVPFWDGSVCQIEDIIKSVPDRYNESQDSVSLLKLEEMLENNIFENVTFQNSEKAIVFYETNVHTPFEGYQIPIYRETSEKDILLEGTFLVEKDTGDIYIRGDKEWVLLKEGILKGLVLPDEPEDVFVHEYDGDNEVVVELLDKVFDFLKTKKGYANFKIKYDGAYSFLGRKYHSVSLIEDINDDMTHTLQRFSVDMETGDLYRESDSEERKELYYMGNLEIEQEAAEAGTEDIKYVDEVMPVKYTDDLSYLADMKYTNSTYVYQDGKVYYRRYHEDSYEETALWGEYDAIPETKKEMICVDAEGVETVLFTDEGYGDIYLFNNRFYLTMSERKESAYGYTYTARCLYSVNMQGKERIDYGEGYVFAIDNERKIIIMQLREESDICYYAVNYETGKKERLCFEYPFDSGAYQDGWFYYERHTGDDITCKLCAVSIEGEEREIIELTSAGNQVSNVREHISDIKVDENRIYFIFGGCDGSLQVFQGGKLISIKLDGTDYRAVETERDAFYLSHDKGKPMVYFVSHYNAPLNENDAMVWDVEEDICYRSDFPADDLNYYEKSIYKDGSIYKNVERMWRYYPATMGSLYSVTRYDSDLQRQKEDIYAIPDDSGKIVRVVTDIEQYITKWEEEEASYIDYEDFYFADGYLYFKVEYSVYDKGTSIGWRDGLRRLHVDICRLKIGENKAEILYSYI